MNNLLPLLCKKVSEVRIRQKASEVRNRLAGTGITLPLRAPARANAANYPSGSNARASNSRPRGAALDEAHVGHIYSAVGMIHHGDAAPRLGWCARWQTLIAVLGPGLIVMVGDNDAGAFGTYTQAGQNYGTALRGSWRRWARGPSGTRGGWW